MRSHRFVQNMPTSRSGNGLEGQAGALAIRSLGVALHLTKGCVANQAGAHSLIVARLG